jgi:hypothetical protein
MEYKGIEYKILRTTSPGIWAWSADPPKSVPIQGKASSPVKAMAAAKRAINNWHKANAEEAGRLETE